VETRQELLLKFMLSLSSNSQILLEADQAELTNDQAADIIFCLASALVDRFYKSLG
jgi:hypothetical protein